MADNNAQKTTPTDITALLSTEEATVVSREAMALQVRERHTTEQSVAYGKRKGNAVCNKAMNPFIDPKNPTQELNALQVISLALNGTI
jgi:hypothetical protein